MTGNPLNGLRLQRAAEAAALRSQGMLQREIADALGLSRSYVAALLNDPDGALDQLRKDGYRGVCLACGGPTNGSDGPANAPDYCGRCNSGHYLRKWTQETVIDAIRRYADLYGHPPRADDGIHADPENGFPPRTAVYDSGNGKSNQPFAYWADAIEAAGFPRPYKGIKYRYGDEPRNGDCAMTSSATRPYLVFQITPEDDLPVLIGRAEASTGDGAILALAVEPQGEWAAVPEQSLQRSRFVVKPQLERIRPRAPITA